MTETTTATTCRRGIWADPSSLIESDSLGVTTIFWSTGNGNQGAVYVVLDGRKEVIFARQNEGSEYIDWLRPGICYEFRLYEYQGLKRSLIEKCVVSQKKIEGIVVSPNPVHFTGDLGWTIVRWSTKYKDAELYVSCNGGTDILCANGNEGGMVVDWLRPDNIYNFKLVSAKDDKLVDSVMVSGDKPFLKVVHSFTELKAYLHKTVIWSSGGDAVCDVYCMSDDNEEVLFATGDMGAQMANWLVDGFSYDFRLYERGNRTKLLKKTDYYPLDDRSILLDTLLGIAVLIAVPMAYLYFCFSKLKILVDRHLFFKRGPK